MTARGTVEDRVEGLDAGAQDYLVKPFEIPELLARVRALLRRSDGASTVLQAGDLRLDRLSRRVTRESDGAAAIEFDGAPSASAVDLYVHYLRRKLGKQVIRTVHRTGYRFGLE